MFKKKVFSVLLSMALVLSLSVSVWALENSENSSPDSNIITYSMENGDLVGTLIDENGNIVPQPRHTYGVNNISPGQTLVFNQSGSSFFVARGRTATFAVSLDNNRVGSIGVKRGNTLVDAKRITRGLVNTISAKAPSDGYYTFYIRNESSNTMQVKGATVEIR